jgi:hypothetical protein
MMQAQGVGRVLVASLHQAIADVLPGRLVFYEGWLNAEGLRDGKIGLAPLYAVLSFLRQEGDAYALVTTRAGAYAAEWTVTDMSPASRRFIETLPPFIRRRVLLDRARTLVRSSYSGTVAPWRIRDGAARVQLKGSVFCSVREPVAQPLCGYYAAAYERMLALFGMPVRVEVVSCRGAGGDACSLNVPFGAVEEAPAQPA